MAPQRLNVLVYTGTGTTSESVRHAMYSLRRLLAPNYAVIPIGEAVLLKEPWAPTCALLVIPGGGDLGYCRVLNGEGNRRIADFVRRGGSYLGLCAGGYYGSRRCEFEVGNTPLEVIGSRELAFFPGTCRGGAFKGFAYASERGARAARLRLATELVQNKMPAEMACYYNGGGIFVDAEECKDNKVQVLASYCDELDVEGGKAAVIQCSVGDGTVILSGIHPEFAAENLHRQADVPGYEDLIASLARDERTRSGFLGLCLERLGLEVNSQGTAPPVLTSLHLSASYSDIVSELLLALRDGSIDQEAGQEIIKGEADTFRLRTKESTWNLKDLREALPDAGAAGAPLLDAHGVPDYKAVTKDIIVHESQLPDAKLTPRFNHKLFFASLEQVQAEEKDANEWGNTLLYGDVVTSTNVLLERNPKLISKLPSGFTFTASTQLAGRGRGTNVWVAPPGSLLFSIIINHPASLAASRPVVFIQYIAAIAVVEAIQSYGRGYEKLQVKLKWPNDIYALDPSKPPSQKSYVKIGGILSQCGYHDGSYQIILGIGINAVNARPTTSLSAMLDEGTAAPLHLETLLARIVARIEAAYAQFRRDGFSADLESRYYRHWLHTGQEIALEAEAGAKARVLGITRDWGMLRVEETDRQGRGTGRIWSLQSDENSFDYWKGLIRRKE